MKNNYQAPVANFIGLVNSDVVLASIPDFRYDIFGLPSEGGVQVWEKQF